MNSFDIEKFTTYSVTLPNGELNEHSFCKLAGYHLLICAGAEQDLAARGQSITDTVAKGYAWALMSMTVRVERPLAHCRPIKCRTWMAENDIPYTRREICFSDEDESPLFAASLYFVPLDIETKHIIKAPELYEPERYATGGILLDGAAYRHRDPYGFVGYDERCVQPSDIDALGHLNNCRYGAMVYDALSINERALISAPFEYVMDFRRQLREGESVSIEKSTSIKDCVYIRGRNDDKRLSFSSYLKPIKSFALLAN